MSKQKKWREVGTDCRGKALLSVSVGKKHSTGQELLALGGDALESHPARDATWSYTRIAQTTK